jgi:asparagine synthase (glutamine-hydrolysing)
VNWKTRELTRGFADILIAFGGDREVPALAVDLSSPIAVESRTASWTIWMIGELFGYGDAAPGAAFGAWCADLEHGCERPEALNGHFVMLANDRRDGSWHAWTDRLGTMHLYYAHNGARAAIGTFHPAVASAASSRRLDWTGLAGFFAFGFFPEDRTHFEDVKIVRPATHMKWDRHGARTTDSRYWNWSFNPDSSRSYDETVDAFGETLSRIVQSQTSSGRVVLPISSGLDSRTIAGVVSACGAPATVSSFSYGYTADSAETRIAAKVASACGLPFERFTIAPYLFDRLDTILDCVEGFGDVTVTRQAAVSKEIAEQGDYVLAGHWGDVWMDGVGFAGGQPHSTDGILDHCLHRIEKPGRRWLLDHVVAARLPNTSIDGMLREVVAAELGRVTHISDPTFRVKAFKTDQWSFRWTVPGLRMFQPGGFPRLPFYDNRMVDLCLTIPSGFVDGRRLQIDYLKRNHPGLARVTWDTSNSSLFLEQYRNSLMLPKRAVLKVARMLSGRRPISRNWEVQFLSAGMRERLMARLSSPGLRIAEFIGGEDVRALAEEFYQGPTGANGYSVAHLLTFATWLERHG